MADDNMTKEQASSMMRETHNKSVYNPIVQYHGIEEKDPQKCRILKKIIELSSIKKNIVKILLKLMKLGRKSQIRTDRMDLKEYAQSIQEKDKFNELQEILGFDETTDMKDSKYTFEQFMSIIKFFIQSPVEKNYIKKIEDELAESDKQDHKINELNGEINKANEKKISDNTKEDKKNYRAGEIRQELDDHEAFFDNRAEKLRNHEWNPELKNENRTKNLGKENPEKQLKEIAVHENKLEKAHQKLNTTISQNTQLREKINVLRKEKNVIEEIYIKLKNELEHKKSSIENTIIEAGRAYINRNTAENELKTLQEKAEKQKEQFEKECHELNRTIQYDRKFKEFLKEKQKEKEQLEKLEREIQINQQIIDEKKANNEAINKEYTHSAQKEEEIKTAFDRIKSETGINECEELLPLFVNLHEKNTTMNIFVNELTKDLEQIDVEISKVKEEIKNYNTKGATKDVRKHELKVSLSEKIVQEEKKKEILRVQYEKSLETMQIIKGYLENILEAIGVSPDQISGLKNSAVTEENLMHYFGILEQKGIEIVSEYSKLIAEQIRLDKGDQPEINQQIDNQINIIEYENANIQNSFFNQPPPKSDFPDDLVDRNESDEIQDHKWFPSREQLKEQALSVQNRQKGNQSTNKSNASHKNRHKQKKK